MRKPLFILLLTLFKITFINAQCYKMLSCGSSHSLAIKMDGSLWAWGENGHGQLGDSTYTTRISPVQIGKDYDWRTVSAGIEYTLAIKKNGTLWAWGGNMAGQLGTGNTSPCIYPKQIGVLNNWSNVFAQSYSSLALKTDGTLWGCGLNAYGELGNGTKIGTYMFTKIGTDTDWTNATTGASFVCAIKKNGSIWAWGSNSSGQLGDGTIIDKLIPKQVGTDTSWQKVSCGESFVAGIKKDGTIWVWGNNYYGQLGNNTSVDSHIPIQVGVATNWKDFFTGAYIGVGLKKDGTLWLWGRNQDGQLGDGTFVDKHVPTKLGNATNWLSFSSTYDSNIAFRTDGSTWGWGANGLGQLGDGTRTVKTTPTALTCPVEREKANIIRGKVFTSNNNNCIQDAGEVAIPNVLMIANYPAKFSNYYALTDSVGKFSIYADSGTYQIKSSYEDYFNPFLKTQYCPSSPSYTIKFDSLGKDTSGFTFAQGVALAPLLQVEMTQTRMRYCADNTGIIKYCNMGTRDTDNVKITVILPPDISFSSASKVPVVNGKNIIFTIGTLKAGECGTINLITKVDCINGISGHTRCFKVAISPLNTTYKNLSKKPGYDNSNILTDAKCADNNKINFKIQNIGDDMTDSSVCRIYQDALLGYTAKFKLHSGDSLIMAIKATGHSYRIEADQSSLYPGRSNPTTSIEGCGFNTGGHMGYITKLPSYEEAMVYKEVCLIILNSYDPNEKSVMPDGVGSSKMVKHKVPLKYTIQFQNTGNDTAYRIVVSDTLSKKLDMSSLQIGASSNPYSLKFTGDNPTVMNFIFDNINLVDSTTNEKGSHGFASFSILPYDTILNGTIIKNTADIYFDHNLPIRTNTTMNTIDDRLPTTSMPIHILNPSYRTLTITACNSYKSPSGKYTWTTSGMYGDTIPNYWGDDSIITISLNLKLTNYSSVNISSCNSYKSPSGKYTWTSSNTYKDTIQNVAGCDSIIQINLTVNYIDNSITRNGDTLTSNQSGASYQWLNCINGFKVINGAIFKSYTPAKNGDYAVQVNINTCTDTSSCYVIRSIGILENKPSEKISISPNPNNGEFIVDFGAEISAAKICIFDISGKKISEGTYENTEFAHFNLKVSKGLYYIVITTQNENAILKFSKE